MRPWWFEPEPGTSQHRSRIGAARMRRKLLKERIFRQQMKSGALWGRTDETEPEQSELAKKLKRSIDRIRFIKEVKWLYLAVPIRGDGREGSNYTVTVAIKPDNPTATIIGMQKNGFWGYSQSGRPTFVLPNSIAGKVTVIDVERRTR